MDTKGILKQVEDELKHAEEETIGQHNVDYVYKLVDIHKDLKNEEYWKKKKEALDMRYGNFGGRYMDYDDSYGRGRSRDSRGRYTESGRSSSSYGRRYRGHDVIDDMYENYGTYMEGKEEYSRGNYGAKEDTMKSLEYMLQSAYDFMCMLKDEAETQEEVDLVRKYARKISEM